MESISPQSGLGCMALHLWRCWAPAKIECCIAEAALLGCLMAYLIISVNTIVMLASG